MKFQSVDPPRKFLVGHPGREIELTHTCDLTLDPDEQVTLRTARGGEFDVVRKDWGYYATPSLNGRLVSFGYRAAIVRSATRRYLLLVEHDRMEAFEAYLESQDMSVIAWIDGDEIDWAGKERPKK